MKPLTFVLLAQVVWFYPEKVTSSMAQFAIEAAAPKRRSARH